MFDNSYSYFKAKKITYSVVMVETPLVEIEKGASKIEEKIFDQNENDISQDVAKIQITAWISWFGIFNRIFFNKLVEIGYNQVTQVKISNRISRIAVIIVNKLKKPSNVHISTLAEDSGLLMWSSMNYAQ